VRWCGAGRLPSRNPSMMASRIDADLRGSCPVSTATVTPALRPVAGVQALAASASSLRTHQIRSRSASADTVAFAMGSLDATRTYQAPARSP